MSRTLVTLAALAAAMLLGSGAAHAQIYPWCAEYNFGGMGGGARNCGFTTLAQCRATISGAGGLCQPNPAYPPATEGRSRRKAERAS